MEKEKIKAIILKFEKMLNSLKEDEVIKIKSVIDSKIGMFAIVDGVEENEKKNIRSAMMEAIDGKPNRLIEILDFNNCECKKEDCKCKEENCECEEESNCKCEEELDCEYDRELDDNECAKDYIENLIYYTEHLIKLIVKHIKEDDEK